LLFISTLLYYETNETLGTNGTLLHLKMAFLYIKRPFLDALYLDFRTKNAYFSLENILKNRFLPDFNQKTHFFNANIGDYYTNTYPPSAIIIWPVLNC